MRCSAEPRALGFWPQQGKEVVEAFIFGVNTGVIVGCHLRTTPCTTVAFYCVQLLQFLKSLHSKCVIILLTFGLTFFSPLLKNILKFIPYFKSLLIILSPNLVQNILQPGDDSDVERY